MGATITNVALLGMLSNIGVQNILGSFLFISMTQNCFFRKDALSDATLFTSLVPFIYVDVMLLILSRSHLFLKT